MGGLGWVRLGFCAAALVLLRAADAGADLQCATPKQREAALQDLNTGAGIHYGDSSEELALYRLVRGIDQELLPVEIRDLSFGDAWIPKVNTPEEQQAQFEELLVPRSQLLDAEAINTFQAAELYLQDSGLHSYRPEYGLGDYPPDWWLDGAHNSVYQTLDVAEWLQTMAASDTYHRAGRGYGKRGYRTLATSWTYFDPWKWDKRGYKRVTDRALDKWRQTGDLLWLAAAFSRITIEDSAETELLAFFDALHAKVKSCGASRAELLVYPLLRFHALRLLIQARVTAPDSFDRALVLLRDPVLPQSVRNQTISDYAAGDRAAHLLAASLGEYGESTFFKKVAVSGRSAPLPYDAQPTYVDAFIDMSWAFAESYEEYLQFAKNRTPSFADVLILNGLSVKSLWALAQSDAFTPEFRLAVVKSAWLRAHLTGQAKLADTILAAVYGRVPDFSDMAPQILAAKGEEKERLMLLMLLRHPGVRIDIENSVGVGRDKQWCGDLNPIAYKAGLDDLFGPVLRMGMLPISEQRWAINWREGLFEIDNTSPDFGARSPSRWATTRPQWLYVYDPQWRESAIDLQELQRLSEIPSAPIYLTQRATAWAEESQGVAARLQGWLGLKADQRPAEALHLAIQVTRHGCRDDEGPVSRQAWIALHKNPRWKEWADKTPYWYD